MNASRFDSLARQLAQPMTRRRAVRAVAGIGASAALSRRVAPEPVLAARKLVYTCPESDTDRGTFQPDTTCAQTFTPTANGKLSEVRIKVDHNGTAGDYVIRIVPVDENGAPDVSRVLAKKVIPAASLPLGAGFLIAKFKSRKTVKLAADKQYAVVVNRPTGHRLKVWMRANDACPGTLFAHNDQTGQFNEATGSDLVFSASVGS